MIHDFIVAHRFLGYAAMSGFLVLSGYGFARLAPMDPIMACGSWSMALLFFAFALATTRALLPVGPILALAVVVGGVVWMARYYDRHRPK